VLVGLGIREMRVELGDHVAELAIATLGDRLDLVVGDAEVSMEALEGGLDLAPDTLLE
jgi:hypothetical protein